MTEGGKRVAAVVSLIALVALGFALFSSGGEDACEKSNYASRACDREIQAEEESACGPGQRIEGFLNCGGREAGERREFREGWEEAEKEAGFYGSP